MSRRAGAMLAVAELELRRMLGGPRPWILAALALAVAALGFVVRRFAPAPDDPAAWGFLYVLLLTFLFLQTLGILVPLLHTSGLVRDDLEDGTLVYLFTRPLEKPLVLLAKLLAAGGLSAAILTGGMLAFHVAFALGGGGETGAGVATHLLPFVAAAVLGVAGYGALFAFVGLLTRRGLVLGIVYGFVSELVLANIPAVVRQLTLMHYLRSVALSRVADGLAHEEEVRELLGVLELVPAGQAALTVLVVAAVGVALSLAAVSRIEFAGEQQVEGD
ncbi:MAG: hypothetical protein M9894_35925 [Planctomycetes bacterium]|nr:hypothetical protein [Planctomycetota bacterium]